MVNGFRKIAWASVFYFLFNVSMSPCLHVPLSRCLHVSMSLSLHVSMSPYHHVSMPLCVHVSLSPCCHVSMYPCLYVSMSPCLHIHVSTFPEYRKQNYVMEKGNFLLFLQTENWNRKLSFICCKWKRMFVFLGRQTINGNRQLLFQQTCPSLEVRNAYNPGRLGGGLASWNSSTLAWVWTRWAFVSLQTKIPKPCEFHKMILLSHVHYRKQKNYLSACVQVKKNKP